MTAYYRTSLQLSNVVRRDVRMGAFRNLGRLAMPIYKAERRTGEGSWTYVYAMLVQDAIDPSQRRFHVVCLSYEMLSETEYRLTGKVGISPKLYNKDRVYLLMSRCAIAAIPPEEFVAFLEKQHDLPRA